MVFHAGREGESVVLDAEFLLRCFRSVMREDEPEGGFFLLGP